MSDNFKDDEDLKKDLEDSLGDETSSAHTGTEGGSSSRDEEEEIRKQSEKETRKVKTWRVLVFLALLATAVSVTATTYVLLVQQEDENFQNVYAQFARTVADAAIDQQRDLRSALRSLSDTLSLSADTMGDGNPPWPFVFPPLFETYAQDYLTISKAEFIGICNVVHHDQRDAWINYSTAHYQQAVQDAHLIKHHSLDKLNNDTDKYIPYISTKTSDGFVEDEERDMYFVRSIQSPPPRKYGPQINWNLASSPDVGMSMGDVLRLRNETIVSNIRPFIGLPEDEHQGFHADDSADNPHCFAYQPIYKYAGDSESDIVAVASSAVAFDASMRFLLPDNVKGMICVIQNSCPDDFSEDQILTYRIEGKEAYFKGMVDAHEPKYDDMAMEVNLTQIAHPDLINAKGNCMYSMKIYPTQAFEDDYKTNTPAIFAAIVAATFGMVALVFLTYDNKVVKRNEMMISKAATSNAVLSDVVPDHLKDRMLTLQQQKNQERKMAKDMPGGRRGSGNLKTFLNDGNNKLGIHDDEEIASAPLADLFLDTTVLFADISGFTAWSSVREPTQVFILLETLFQAFDRIAKKRRVFKVETVGDCYVACCGLPDPRKEHAVVMARFASDILNKFHLLTRKLEVTLGPDTTDLALRIGMHSGPVTAGVLRGERSRFQLFGDTMNCCARLESTSKPNRIQCSKETAEQLQKFGKGAWLQERAEPLTLKGLGTVEGFWVTVRGDRAGSVASGSSNNMELIGTTPTEFQGLDERTMRLVNWNVEMLARILKEIAAKRASRKRTSTKNRPKKVDATAISFESAPLDEVREIIELPEFDRHAATKNPEEQRIPADVVEQLTKLVSVIATMYNDNPFHSFDHASHVVMSVIKLMSRIVASSQTGDLDNDSDHAAASHDHTYGITSDPLTQFACAFSALIHDVDHVGVSNAQLVKEGLPIASYYSGRSVAEQNSLDISWDCLMQPEYEALRAFLFETEADLFRFRQLVVNSVMATDIVDKQLKELRNGRWEVAFKKDGGHVDSNKRDQVNRKATIVIEHIIQASDISHTMQHWHVYRKWNQNLFEELYVAYLNGRMENDPATFWYKGEIGFFDFYIIPLTQKLKECGVFGVSSGEYLNYAQKNREEWVTKGEEVVDLLVKEAKEKYGEKGAVKTQALPEQAPRLDLPEQFENEVEV